MTRVEKITTLLLLGVLCVAGGYQAGLRAVIGVEPSQVAMGATEHARSSCWHKTKAEYDKTHPVCEACGGKDDLQTHHIIPFNRDPSKECEVTNCIRLCRRDHLLLGHAGDYHYFNERVREDAKRIREMIASRQRNEPE